VVKEHNKKPGKRWFTIAWLTFLNPVFLPTAHSPALICFGRERGWWITCNYSTVLKEKNVENRKSTTCAICGVKSVLHEEKPRTGSNSGRTNATKTVSDVFQHRSGIGKSYCRTRFDVGSGRVKIVLIYGAETCSLYEDDRRRINVTGTDVLRRSARSEKRMSILEEKWTRKVWYWMT
jgi:hypothetical protein